MAKRTGTATATKSTVPVVVTVRACRAAAPDSANAAVGSQLENHRVGSGAQARAGHAHGYPVLALADRSRPAQPLQAPVHDPEQNLDVIPDASPNVN